MKELWSFLCAHKRELIGIAMVSFAGLFSLENSSLRDKSLDCLFFLRGRLPSNKTAAEQVAIVFMDVAAATNSEPYVALLKKLAESRVRAVVFDIVLDKPHWNERQAEMDFGAAITQAIASANMKIVFAAQGYEEWKDGNLQHLEHRPAEWIDRLVGRLTDDTAIGVLNLLTQRVDGVIRTHSSFSGYADEPLALAAAKLFHYQVSPYINLINYYGPAGTIPNVEFKEATTGAQDWRSVVNNRVVFVGQGPATSNQKFSRDHFKTPFTRFSGLKSSGVEIHATIFLNFVRKPPDWIKNFTRAGEWFAVLMVGLLCGVWFTRWTPLDAAWIALCGALLAAGVSFLVFSASNRCFPWLVITLVQLPAACAVALLPVKSAFISYRRADGKAVAGAIADKLNLMGIQTYLDKAAHDSGKLKEILFPQIRNRRNFILILTPELLKRWSPGNDWIAAEITQALDSRRQIIPVYVDDVRFFIEAEYSLKKNPLPREVSQVLSEYIRASYNSDLADASVASIARKLRVEVKKNWGRRPKESPYLKHSSHPPVA
jgi:CHASE2 domain-containing sensor protein